MGEEQPKATQTSFGWRQLLGAVNLRDFAEMVGGELVQIGASARLAVAAFTALPLGPLIGLAGLALIVLRLVLLVLVVVVFGGAILIISAVRALAGRGRREGDT